MYGNTALHIASIRGHAPIVEKLLYQGSANPEIENMEGWKSEDLIFSDKVKQIFEKYDEEKNLKADMSITMLKIISVLESELKRLKLGRITPSQEAQDLLNYQEKLQLPDLVIKVKLAE